MRRVVVALIGAAVVIGPGLARATTEPPIDPNDLAAVHADCIGDSIFVDWESMDPLVAPDNREIWSEISSALVGDDETPTEYVRRVLLADTFNPDEATVTIDGAYQPDAGGEYYTPAGLLLGLLFDCLAVDLAMPGDVRSHVAQTRAKDGFQKDAWGQYAAQWSYPDDGLNISIWITNPESLPLETVPPVTYDIPVIAPAWPRRTTSQVPAAARGR